MQFMIINTNGKNNGRTVYNFLWKEYKLLTTFNEKYFSTFCNSIQLNRNNTSNHPLKAL